jgi:hypothetical protein
MTLYEFKLLNDNDQAQTVWDSGVLLGFRQEGSFHMALYRIDNFYVEIQYHTERNEIDDIKSFVSDGPLQPYLAQISLEGLF